MRRISLLALVAILGGCQEKPPTPAEFRALAAKGLTESVRRASALGVKLDATDENGFSALSMAAYNGCRDTVEALLKLGANPDSGPPISRALVTACSQNQKEIVEILIKHGAKVEYGEKEDQPVAATDNPQILDMLVRAGANVNKASGPMGTTALHQCASKGAVPAVRFLISRGARVNAVNINGVTPLHLACRTPSLLLQTDGVKRAKETIRLLIAAGAMVKIADVRGNTPLHLAARNAYLGAEDLQVLIDAGASLDAKDSLRRTPLMVAKVFGTDRLPGRLEVLSSNPADQPK